MKPDVQNMIGELQMPDLNEFEPDLFTIEDEDGNEQTFELVDVYK